MKTTMPIIWIFTDKMEHWTPYLIRNSSFLLLNAFSILIIIGSERYFTIEPNETTIIPCSEDWTRFSISGMSNGVLIVLDSYTSLLNKKQTGFLYPFKTLHQSKITLPVFFLIQIYLPSDRGLASSDVSPSIEMTLGNNGFGWSIVKSLLATMYNWVSSMKSNHLLIFLDTSPRKNITKCKTTHWWLVMVNWATPKSKYLNFFSIKTHKLTQSWMHEFMPKLI